MGPMVELLVCRGHSTHNPKFIRKTCLQVQSNITKRQSKSHRLGGLVIGRTGNQIGQWLQLIQGVRKSPMPKSMFSPSNPPYPPPINSKGAINFPCPLLPPKGTLVLASYQFYCFCFDFCFHFFYTVSFGFFLFSNSKNTSKGNCCGPNKYLEISSSWHSLETSFCSIVTTNSFRSIQIRQPISIVKISMWYLEKNFSNLYLQTENEAAMKARIKEVLQATVR